MSAAQTIYKKNKKQKKTKPETWLREILDQKTAFTSKF